MPSPTPPGLQLDTAVRTRADRRAEDTVPVHVDQTLLVVIMIPVYSRLAR